MPRPVLFLFTLILACMQTGAVQAQSAIVEPGNDPLEITADESLEWKRTDQLFIARKNALATQGDVSIAAETLTAFYKDGSGSESGSGLDIYKVTADVSVKIKNQDSVAYGDHAVYDLDKGLATLTGDALRMTSPGQTITAQERFEYWVTDGRAIAIGRPRVIRPKPGGGQDILDADEIVATFKENAQGEQVIDTLEAKRNVIITTPSEVITGAYGLYKEQTNTAELTGDVTITRGPNILKGERAIVDLNTNTSRVFGNTNAGGRVKGVFYPGSEKKDKEKTASHDKSVQGVQLPQPLPTGAITPAAEDNIEPAAPAIEINPEALPSTAPESPENIEPEAGHPTASDNWAPLTRP